jgi:hypothetical protein
LEEPSAHVVDELPMEADKVVATTQGPEVIRPGARPANAVDHGPRVVRWQPDQQDEGWTS